MTDGISDVLGSATIIHKTYKFYLFLYSCIELLPKRDRFTIGAKCENITLEILELLFTANAKQKHVRLQELDKVDLKLKILKTCIRLAYDTKALDQKRYLVLEKQLQEVGKMLGGWIKATRLELDKG